MSEASPELADVFKAFGQKHEDAYGPKLMPSQRRCLRDVVRCMTPEMGGRRYHCHDCDDSFWHYHGCSNRSCPKCHGPKTAKWLALREAEMLPCPYFHVIVTVPSELRSEALGNQKIIYGMLMKISAECVRDLAKDQRFVGGEVGILSVLHTWTGELRHHPHVHMLVTGGGIDEGRKYWLDAKKDYLLSVQALSKMIRHRFAKELERCHPEIYEEVPETTWGREWCSFCKPFGKGNEAVLKYLARYVFRIAISNARILSINGSHVRIRYKDHNTNQFREAQVPGVEFIRRYLQHVLPQGFHKVRYYGLWAPVNRLKMKQARVLLEMRGVNVEEDEPIEAVIEASPEAEEEQGVVVICPKCGGTHTELTGILDPAWRTKTA